MKRLMLFGWILMMTLAILFSAQAEEWGVSGELEGNWTISSQGAPDCIIQYVLPQFVVDDSADEAINRFFASMADGVLPERFGAMAEGSQGVQVSYLLTYTDDRYLSLLLLADDGFGGSALQPMTFARDGIYAGEKIGLAELLGLETEDGQNAGLNQMVCGLVWDIVRKGAENMDRSYLENLSLEVVEAALNPEWDFVLDENGNVVFLIAPGELAAEVDGVLEFPFAPVELLNAMK